MAIEHNRRTTRTELQRVFCRWIYFYLRSKIFFWPSSAGEEGGAIVPIAPPPPMDPSLTDVWSEQTHQRRTRHVAISNARNR